MMLPIPSSRHQWGLAGLLFLTLSAAPGLTASGDERGPGFGTIRLKDVEAHVRVLADPGMEGRDTPSEGQARAARYLIEHYEKAGLQPASDSLEVMGDYGAGGPDVETRAGSFYRPFLREKDAPNADGCRLTFSKGKESTPFEFGSDFVPVHRAAGSAQGELVFAGFGIDSSKYKYNDFKSLSVRKSIVMFFEGEPRHKKKFDGEETTPASSLFAKLATLNKAGAAGALIVRRAPQGAEDDDQNHLDFRYTYATFNDPSGGRGARQPAKSLPSLIISMDCASAILGQDALKLAKKMDKSGRPTKVKLKGVEIQLDSSTHRTAIRHDNLLGILPGSDPTLANEYVFVGAHYDHIGVGAGGRVACGADDNGSGCSAFLEVLKALADHPPKRSIIFANFTGEEDGLVGSGELVKRLPVPASSIVCMVNLDMVGFGEASEVNVLGVNRNPKLQKVLDRAKRLQKTGLRKVITGKGEDLWQRSDHYNFHKQGIPVLFFFEGLPISRNKDYHTWRDTPDKVNYPKVTNTARMVYNTVWLLANDEERPPQPRE